MRVPRFIFEVRKLVFVSFSAWCVWDLCHVQRSRGKDVQWPTQRSMRIAPGPATRASGLRQLSAEAALQRNLKKARKGYGPLAKGAPGAPGSGSKELALWPPSGGGSWQIAPEALRRLLANLAGGSRRPLQRVLANFAGTPSGRSSGSWQAQTWWSSQGWQNWPNE